MSFFTFYFQLWNYKCWLFDPIAILSPYWHCSNQSFFQWCVDTTSSVVMTLPIPLHHLSCEPTQKVKKGQNQIDEIHNNALYFVSSTGKHVIFRIPNRCPSPLFFSKDYIVSSRVEEEEMYSLIYYLYIVSCILVDVPFNCSHLLNHFVLFPLFDNNYQYIQLGAIVENLSWFKYLIIILPSIWLRSGNTGYYIIFCMCTENYIIFGILNQYAIPCFFSESYLLSHLTPNRNIWEVIFITLRRFLCIHLLINSLINFLYFAWFFFTLLSFIAVTIIYNLSHDFFYFLNPMKRNCLNTVSDEEVAQTSYFFSLLCTSLSITL